MATDLTLSELQTRIEVASRVRRSTTDVTTRQEVMLADLVARVGIAATRSAATVA